MVFKLLFTRNTPDDTFSVLEDLKERENLVSLCGENVNIPT